jgi:hypothetical protein
MMVITSTQVGGKYITSPKLNLSHGDMAKLVYAQHLSRCVERREGSTPSISTDGRVVKLVNTTGFFTKPLPFM